MSLLIARFFHSFQSYSYFCFQVTWHNVTTMSNKPKKKRQGNRQQKSSTKKQKQPEKSSNKKQERGNKKKGGREDEAEENWEDELLDRGAGPSLTYNSTKERTDDNSSTPNLQEKTTQDELPFGGSTSSASQGPFNAPQANTEYTPASVNWERTEEREKVTVKI